mgnify:CR=1 FL=1
MIRDIDIFAVVALLDQIKAILAPVTAPSTSTSSTTSQKSMSSNTSTTHTDGSGESYVGNGTMQPKPSRSSRTRGSASALSPSHANGDGTSSSVQQDASNISWAKRYGYWLMGYDQPSTNGTSSTTSSTSSSSSLSSSSTARNGIKDSDSRDEFFDCISDEEDEEQEDIAMPQELTLEERQLLEDLIRLGMFSSHQSILTNTNSQLSIHTDNYDRQKMARLAASHSASRPTVNILVQLSRIQVVLTQHVEFPRYATETLAGIVFSLPSRA